MIDAHTYVDDRARIRHVGRLEDVERPRFGSYTELRVDVPAPCLRATIREDDGFSIARASRDVGGRAFDQRRCRDEMTAARRPLPQHAVRVVSETSHSAITEPRAGHAPRRADL